LAVFPQCGATKLRDRRQGTQEMPRIPLPILALRRIRLFLRGILPGPVKFRVMPADKWLSQL
jgi:hypothetical protein